MNVHMMGTLWLGDGGNIPAVNRQSVSMHLKTTGRKKKNKDFV